MQSVCPKMSKTLLIKCDLAHSECHEWKVMKLLDKMNHRKVGISHSNSICNQIPAFKLSMMQNIKVTIYK